MLNSSKRPPGPVLLAWVVAVALTLGLIGLLVYGLILLLSRL